MRRKMVLAVFLLLLLPTVVFADDNGLSGEEEVGIYAPEEFAPKGTIAEGADKFIEKIRNLKKSYPGYQVYIWVSGSADTTGSGAANDLLAERRAENMRNYLESNLGPDKKTFIISKLSVGSLYDDRVVRIKWELVPQQAQAAGVMDERDVKIYALVLLSIIGFLVVGGLIVNLLNHRKRIKKRRDRVADENWSGFVEVNGTGYKVMIGCRSGVWYGPFHNLDHQDIPIHAPTKSDLLSALKRCLKPGSKFEDQIPGLVKEVLIMKTK